MSTICLASGSPRRAELLRQIGVEFFVRVADIDETRQGPEMIAEYVARIARSKAEAVAADLGTDTPILAADTAIDLDGVILGKPRNAEDAIRILSLLSGRSHRVLSGVILCYGQHRAARVSETEVRFKPLSDTEIRDYARSGEALDKAGAYAIQGRAAAFISEICGSYSGVMGLPLYETAGLIAQLEKNA